MTISPTQAPSPLCFSSALDIPSSLFVLLGIVHLFQQNVSFVQQSDFVQHCISSEQSINQYMVSSQQPCCEGMDGWIYLYRTILVQRCLKTKLLSTLIEYTQCETPRPQGKYTEQNFHKLFKIYIFWSFCLSAMRGKIPSYLRVKLQ